MADTPLPQRADIRRILIIKWSAMGDLVMATAPMEDVFRAFPGREIDLNTMPAFTGLFRHDPRFRDVFAIDVRRKGSRPANNLAWLRHVRAGHYDLIIDLQRTDHTRALLGLLRLAGAAPRHMLGNRGGFPYSRTPAVTDPGAHALAMMRSVLECAGIPVATDHPVLHSGAEAVVRARALIDSHGLDAAGPFAVFLPGSQAAGWLKRWGVERFRRLAALLRADGLAGRIAVIGGPDEVEDCREISAAGDFLVNLNGRIGLLEIAPLCAQAGFIIANDTGTAHMAAAARRPMLVLCGPTDPRRVKPIGPRVRAIQVQLPCRNCYAKDCLIADRHACMAKLTPEFVAAEARAMLEDGVNPLEPALEVLRVQEPAGSQVSS